jgi:hypothetical protein
MRLGREAGVRVQVSNEEVRLDQLDANKGFDDEAGQPRILPASGNGGERAAQVSAHGSLPRHLALREETVRKLQRHWFVCSPDASRMSVRVSRCPTPRRRSKRRCCTAGSWPAAAAHARAKGSMVEPPGAGPR